MHEIKHRAVRLHRVLGNPLRVKILDALAAGPLTPGRLAFATHRLLPAVSRALSILAQAELVENRTVGHAVLYRLKHPAILGLLRHAESVVQRFNLPALPPIRDVQPEPDDPLDPAPGRAS
jgi:DNA-binding transcriptional ArsR family regulator